MSRLVLLMLCVYSLAEAAPDRGIVPLAAAPTDPGAPRLALVIGNANYARPLQNPVADARAMAAVLEKLKFTVIERENLDRAQMERVIREFGDRLNGKSVGLFYYAGHGVQVDGENYLVPLGVELEREDEVKFQAVPAGLVLVKMENARNVTNIVILDACRDNPFRSAWRTLSPQGLATMNAPIGTVISYATAPGRTAADGPGKHGVYTGHLLSEMQTVDTPIELVFKRVRQRVVVETGGRQVPWEATSLRGEFYFASSQPVAAARLSEPSLPASTSQPLSQTAPPLTAEALRETSYRPKLIPIVRKSEGFGGLLISESEVTQGQYKRLLQINPSEQHVDSELKASLCRVRGVGDHLPVFCVSLADALQYVNQISTLEGLLPCYVRNSDPSWSITAHCEGYRLPTVEEWLFAAKAGTSSRFAGSDILREVGWYNQNAHGRVHPIKTKRPNVWGIYDMSGNVYEWSTDPYDASLIQSQSTGTLRHLGDSERVILGGSFFQPEAAVRLGVRMGMLPASYSTGVGIRIVRSVRELRDDIIPSPKPAAQDLSARPNAR